MASSSMTWMDRDVADFQDVGITAAVVVGHGPERKFQGGQVRIMALAVRSAGSKT